MIVVMVYTVYAQTNQSTPQYARQLPSPCTDSLIQAHIQAVNRVRLLEDPRDINEMMGFVLGDLCASCARDPQYDAVIVNLLTKILLTDTVFSAREEAAGLIINFLNNEKWGNNAQIYHALTNAMRSDSDPLVRLRSAVAIIQLCQKGTPECEDTIMKVVADTTTYVGLVPLDTVPECPTCPSVKLNMKRLELRHLAQLIKAGKIQDKEKAIAALGKLMSVETDVYVITAARGALNRLSAGGQK